MPKELGLDSQHRNESRKLKRVVVRTPPPRRNRRHLTFLSGWLTPRSEPTRATQLRIHEPGPDVFSGIFSLRSRGRQRFSFLSGREVDLVGGHQVLCSIFVREQHSHREVFGWESLTFNHCAKT